MNRKVEVKLGSTAIPIVSNVMSVSVAETARDRGNLRYRRQALLQNTVIRVAMIYRQILMIFPFNARQ